MDVEQLIQEKPAFHTDGDGVKRSWAVHPNVLRFMNGVLQEDMKTIETGSGHTTVLFALAGTDHICITPSEVEGNLITEYCRQNEIEPAIRFDYRSSDIALADAGNLPDHLDFVFIDGAHRFPYPCIDFHYTAKLVPIGGIVGVDDYSMPSVKILYDFLVSEPEWKLLNVIKQTAFFQRIAETKVFNDWQAQVMNSPLLKRHSQRGWISKARSILNIK